MKIIKILFVVVFILIVATPLIKGVFIKNYFYKTIEEFEKIENINHEIKSYKLGFFKSYSTIYGEYLIDNTSKVSYEINHVINHTITLDNELAWIESKISILSEHKNISRHYYGNASPIVFLSTVDFKGNITVSFSSPGFNNNLHDEANSSIQWAGFKGDAHYDAKNNEYELELYAPFLKYVDNDGITVHATNIRALITDVGDISTSNETIKGKFSAISVQSDNYHIHIADINWTSKIENINDLSNYFFSTSSSIIKSEIDKKYYETHNVGFRANLKNIDFKAMQNLLKQLSITTEIMGDTDKLDEIDKELLQRFLVNSPQLIIDSNKIKTDNGSLQFDLNLFFNGKKLKKNDDDYFNNILAKTEIILSKELLENIFKYIYKDKVKKLLKDSKKGKWKRNINLLSTAYAMGSVENALNQGSILEKQDEYVIKLKLNNGEFTINKLPGDILISGLSVFSSPTLFTLPFKDKRLFQFNNVTGHLGLFIWGNASLESVDNKLIVEINEGTLQINPRIKSVMKDKLKDKVVKSFTIQLAKSTGKGWDTSKCGTIILLDKILSDPEEEIDLSGYKFEMQIDNPIELADAWIVFTASNGEDPCKRSRKTHYWFSHGPRDLFFGCKSKKCM